VNRPKQRVACLAMSTRRISPGLNDGLRSLAESQLQMQTVRSAALDGGALGVMAVERPALLS
jgi:hypothetical protein